MTDTGSNESLTVEVDATGIIIASGDIDLAGGPVLEAAILQGENDHPIVIDLAGVVFIDSSGLRSLLGASRRATERGTDVVLRSSSPEVLRLLEITGTTSQFRLEGSAG
jgi:anti-sigma B factor antagonist